MIPTLNDLLIWMVCPACGEPAALMPWTLQVLPHQWPPFPVIPCPTSGAYITVALLAPIPGS